MKLHLTLINMPFVGISRPSLGLTQLLSLVSSEFSDQIAADVLYFNIDFAKYLGEELYASICYRHNETGLGDWFFRQVAFPELADNSDKYFGRYFAEDTATNRHLRLTLLRKRRNLEDYIDALITKHCLGGMDFVGFTSTFAQNTASFAMARKIKTHFPNVLTLIGGANCETAMGLEICQQVKAIDFVFSGSALSSFPTFLRSYLQGGRDNCHYIDGVFSKENLGLSDVNRRSLVDGTSGRPWDRGMDVNIDLHIPLRYQAFIEKLGREFPKIPPVLLFETSRGCWWGEKAHCTFCGLNGDSMAYRAKTPQKALVQIEELFHYSDRCTYFECVDNIMPKHYLKEVLPFISRPHHVRLFYEVKADLQVHELEIMAQAGVTVIQPGIESLSTPTLKLMKKGMTAFQNISFLKNCRTLGILPVWNLLVGFPGESEDMYRKYMEVIPRLTHLFPPRGVFPIGFHRYSPYHKWPDKFGLDLRPLDHYSLTFPFSNESLAQLAYCFEDHNSKAPYIQTMTMWMPKITEITNNWIHRWFGSDQWSHLNSYEGPKLYFAEGEDSTIVLDSRSGALLAQDVGQIGKQVLRSLGRQKSLATLERDFSHIHGFDAAKEITILKARGLLFEEDDDYLSLVHNVEPRTQMQWFPW